MKQIGKITRIVNEAVIYDGLTVEDADKIIGMLEEMEKQCIISHVVCSATRCMACEDEIKKDEGLLFCAKCGL